MTTHNPLPSIFTHIRTTLEVREQLRTLAKRDRRTMMQELAYLMDKELTSKENNNVKPNF
jgi:hypothetical protein